MTPGTHPRQPRRHGPRSTRASRPQATSTTPCSKIPTERCSSRAVGRSSTGSICRIGPAGLEVPADGSANPRRTGTCTDRHAEVAGLATAAPSCPARSNRATRLRTDVTPRSRASRPLPWFWSEWVGKGHAGAPTSCRPARVDQRRLPTPTGDRAPHHQRAGEKIRSGMQSTRVAVPNPLVFAGAAISPRGAVGGGSAADRLDGGGELDWCAPPGCGPVP